MARVFKWTCGWLWLTPAWPDPVTQAVSLVYCYLESKEEEEIFERNEFSVLGIILAWVLQMTVSQSWKNYSILFISPIRFVFAVAFDIYDMDKDGYISNGELFQVLKMMVGSNLKDTQLQQIVDKTIINADLDGDGKISYEEFCNVSITHFRSRLW